MALIAVIDDDPDILDASSLVLSAKGYEVITANNPDDGYKIVKEKNPDLIILDVMMNEPDDGFFSHRNSEKNISISQLLCIHQYQKHWVLSLQQEK